jgi:hypothetical protein
VYVDAFLQGLRERGYEEGRNFDVVDRFADGYIERLPALAEEVVRLPPNVILAATLKLDKELLSRYPEGYRHLAYSLVKSGNKVQTNMPGLDGPELEAVYARGAAWLDGKPLEMPH